MPDEPSEPRPGTRAESAQTTVTELNRVIAWKDLGELGAELRQALRATQPPDPRASQGPRGELGTDSSRAEAQAHEQTLRRRAGELARPVTALLQRLSQPFVNRHPSLRLVFHDIEKLAPAPNPHASTDAMRINARRLLQSLEKGAPAADIAADAAFFLKAALSNESRLGGKEAHLASTFQNIQWARHSLLSTAGSRPFSFRHAAALTRLMVSLHPNNRALYSATHIVRGVEGALQELARERNERGDSSLSFGSGRADRLAKGINARLEISPEGESPANRRVREAVRDLYRAGQSGSRKTAEGAFRRLERALYDIADGRPAIPGAPSSVAAAVHQAAERPHGHGRTKGGPPGRRAGGIGNHRGGMGLSA